MQYCTTETVHVSARNYIRIPSQNRVSSQAEKASNNLNDHVRAFRLKFRSWTSNKHNKVLDKVLGQPVHCYCRLLYKVSSESLFCTGCHIELSDLGYPLHVS